MITNWLKINLRILFKYRLYTGISLFGLAIAISSFWFIANFVKNSYQYDTFHKHAERIYRLTMEITAGGNTDHYATTGKPLGDLLYRTRGGIGTYSRMASLGTAVVHVNDEFFDEKGFFNTNPETLDVFSFNFLAGSKTNWLSSPSSVLLARSLAEKYFNSTDILDKQITINDNEYYIKGVYEDWPKNSHLEVRALIQTNPATTSYEPQDWFDLEHYTYVLLHPTTSQKDLNDRLQQLTTEQLHPILDGSGIEVKLGAQPLVGLYFEPGLTDDISKGNLTYVNALAFSGILVLIIAGLNHINLTLTQSTKRSKEISLKKILGISKKQLILQSGTESILMTLLALSISIMLIFSFDNMYMQNSGFTALDLGENWLFLVILLLITFVFGLLGSSYSGVYLSFSNTLMLKEGTSVNSFKKVLLTFQFVITTVIIIATLTLNRQINYMKNKDLGFSREQVLVVGLPDYEEMRSRFAQFKTSVKKFATVENASLIAGGALPGEENGKEIFQVAVNGVKTERVFNIYRIDEDYFDLLDIQFASGRNFEKSRPSDKNESVIINEALARSLGWKNPLGQTIQYQQPLNVIGVVRNFHNQSLHTTIEPIVFIYDDNYPSNLLVKARTTSTHFIKSLWTDSFPDIPFSLTYFDQFLDAKYSNEDQLAQLLGLFSIISLILSCMGLFAIFSLHVLQKTKEMSIRKVLGAGWINLLQTASRSYLMLTLLAIGMAVPIGWVITDGWLNEFSYKIQLDPLIFICSASVILLASCMTLTYHILKALFVNPVETLKCE